MLPFPHPLTLRNFSVMHKNGSGNAHRAHTPAAIERARGRADAVNGALKRTMHRWFGDNGSADKAALAEAMDTSVGTVSRQMQINDLPVQSRLMAAIRELLPELHAELRAAEERELELDKARRPSGLLMQAFWGLIESSAAAQGALARAMADGEIDTKERAEALALLAHLRNAVQALETELRSSESHVIRIGS